MPIMTPSFLSSADRVLLMDGAMGTELQRAGVRRKRADAYRQRAHRRRDALHSRRLALRLLLGFKHGRKQLT